MITENEIKELIKNVEMATFHQPLYYFALNKRILNDAIIYFKDSEIIVVDRKNNMWQRGQKLEEKYGVAYE